MENRSITISFLTRTGLMLALALVFQIGFRAFAQPAVGPLVNMVLIMSGALVGTLSGIIVGCLTPLIAFFVGIMPKFPLIPFIMIGNALLVIIFNYIRNKTSKWGDYLGLIGAAFVKFVWLAFSVRYLVKLFMPKVPAKLIVALSLPQLYTALIGGFLAVLIIKMLPKNIFNK
ncbi:ECF transporter S component [Caloranaerobacter ferrireducens]|uniref:ECF transporter S component n=1 Tax=Caloranaerobacter ferrireducens TaxID=1323370 RepID=UPI001A9A46BE|nr:ECF transporter S component [Caloranaerobacter ferrireducens]